jgi:hypothetical protein
MPDAESQRTQAAAAQASVYDRALRADLERRLTALGATSDDAFGMMGVGDGILVVGLFVVGPALVAWLFR